MTFSIGVKEKWLEKDLRDDYSTAALVFPSFVDSLSASAPQSLCLLHCVPCPGLLVFSVVYFLLSCVLIFVAPLVFVYLSALF